MAQHGDIIADTKNVLWTVFVYIIENSLKKFLQFSEGIRLRSKKGTVEEVGTNDKKVFNSTE